MTPTKKPPGGGRLFKVIAVLAIFVIALIGAWMIHPALAAFVALLGYPAIDGVLSHPRER